MKVCPFGLKSTEFPAVVGQPSLFYEVRGRKYESLFGLDRNLLLANNVSQPGPKPGLQLAGFLLDSIVPQ